MTKFIRVAATPLALLVVFGACKKADESPASRDVQLAPAATAQPQLADTATTATTTTASAAVPTPAKPVKPAKSAAPKVPSASQTPRAPAAAPEPERTPTTGTVAVGASLPATVDNRICTNTHKVGDRVTAALASAVEGTNGIVIPAGATVMLGVTESKRGENGKEGIRLVFEPISVASGDATYAISGTVSVANLETVRVQTTGDQAKKVAIGAAVGALAGQLLGRKTKSTVIGAAVGAAAGGAVAVGSTDWNGCLAEGGRVTVMLGAPLTIRRAP